MTVGEASIDVDLLLEDSAAAAGGVSFAGWRSMEIADAFQLGDTIWLVPLDRQGIFTLTFSAAQDKVKLTAPRTDWSFELIRVSKTRKRSDHRG